VQIAAHFFSAYNEISGNSRECAFSESSDSREDSSEWRREMTRLRYLPDEPLPPYTHIPGQTPHPYSDPAGHSYGVAREQPPPIDPQRSSESLALLRGIDLFNAGFYWEAHEAWEGLWHAAGRCGVTAVCIKGLIQLAVAGVKHYEGIPEGVSTHAHRAAELFREVASGDVYLGIPLLTLIALGETIGDKGWPEDAPVIPLVIPPR
jgi:hypothetical protein